MTRHGKPQDILGCMCLGQALEADCFASSVSTAVYRGRLANAARHAKALESAGEVGRLAHVKGAAAAGAAGGASMSSKHAGALPCDAAAASSGGAAAVLGDRSAEGTHQSAAEVGSSSDTLHSVRTCLDEVMGQLTGMHAEADSQSVASRIAALGNARVTSAMLREEGFGHRLKALSKCGHVEVAAAAKQVMKIWKERVCKEVQ